MPRTHFLALALALVTPAARTAAAGADASAPTPKGALPAALPGPVTKPAAKPAGKVAKGAKPAARKNGPVELYHVNRRETLQLRLRDASGKPIKGQQKRVERFLRCHHTNTQHAMSPRLTSLLYQTGRHWPGHRLEVVSGYRHPNVAKNPRSPHMKGLACDFRVVGISNTELRDYLRRAYNKVGVGYYPNSSFVHLDVRKDRSAFWIDYSGPGERALYSAAPSDDLKTGRADQFRPTKIDSAWLDDAPPPPDMAPPAPGAGATAHTDTVPAGRAAEARPLALPPVGDAP